MLPKLFTKKFLGIDIGTSAIRIVELEKAGHDFSLSNYGQIDIDQINGDASKITKTAVTVFSSDDIAEMMQAIIENAKIKTRQCAFSIPDFSTFFTAFSLPPMTEKEIPEAVIFEARQHIPLPMESVTIDWQVVGGGGDESKNLEVTVAAIPNEIISQYKDIAAKTGLEVVLMEAEMFGLAQALIESGNERTTCLVDIGTQSTVCSLVDKKNLKYSHSFDRGGNYLIEEIIKRIPVSQDFANNIKKNYGLKLFSLTEPEVRSNIALILKESLTPVFKEIEIILSDYKKLSNATVDKIIISGGVGAVSEVRDQFADYFKIGVEIANPFKGIYYRPELEQELKIIGPGYAVAVGMAKRGLDFSKPAKK